MSDERPGAFLLERKESKQARVPSQDTMRQEKWSVDLCYQSVGNDRTNMK